MEPSLLQRGSIAVFSALRGALERVEAWAQISPGRSAWFFRPEDDDALEETRFRNFNRNYFASLHQQERMLADQPRVNFYHEMVRRHVRPGDRVIDLGTGTGILAAWASRAGAAQVWALDHSDILTHAKTLAAENGIENVEFVATHSTDFTLPEPVDVILHEQMGDFLFDEGMARNVCDLRDRLLKPGGRILPSCFELFCEPVQLHDDRRIPFIWELNVHGFEYAGLEKNRPQEDDYYRIASCDDGMVARFVSEPEPVLRFDLLTLDERTMSHELHYEREVREAGRIDALAVFFRVQADDDLSLSTNPLDRGRAPHWGYRLLRVDQNHVEAGERFAFTLEVGSWADSDSWRWSYAAVEPVAVD